VIFGLFKVVDIVDVIYDLLFKCWVEVVVVLDDEKLVDVFEELFEDD